MFAEEKPTLLPLPLEPFRYYQYGERIVHLDGCVEVEAAYYVHRRAGSAASSGCMDELYVRLLDPKTGQLLREHVRQKRGWYRIKEETTPSGRRCALPNCCGERPRRSHIGALCDAIHRQQGEVGVRRILGVLSLAKKYGTRRSMKPAPPRWTWECRNIASSAAIWNAAQAPLSLQQVDPLIRELVQYRDFINYRTKEIEE